MAGGRGWWLAAAAALAIGYGDARADVVPGDRIDAQSVEKVKHLVSPGLEWCIKRGWPITISEPSLPREGTCGPASFLAPGRAGRRRAPRPASRARRSDSDDCGICEMGTIAAIGLPSRSTTTDSPASARCR